MVAPSASLGTNLFNFAPFNGTYNTNVTNIGGYGSSTDWRTTFTTTSGVLHFIEYLTPSLTTHDLTNAIIHWAMFFNGTGTYTNQRVGLRSGAGNYRLWTSIIGHFNNDLSILGVASGTYTDTGTFNPAAVDGFRVEFTRGTTGTAELNLPGGAPFYSRGYALRNGEVGNRANFSLLVTALTARYGAASTRVTNQINGFGDFLRTPYSILIGAGTNATIEPEAIGIVFSPESLTPSNTVARKITPDPSVVIDTGATANILPSISVAKEGAGDDYDFVDSSDATNTVSVVLTAPRNCDFGNGNYSGRLINAVGVASKGNEVSVIFGGTSAAYDYEYFETADLMGAEFAGTSAHFINFDGANFADGHNADLSGVTFSGTPGTKHFRVDATGKSLTITVASDSGLTIDDVTVIAGSVTVQAPQLSFAWGAIANGSRLFAARQQSFKIQSADINTSTDQITLGLDDETSTAFAGQTTTPATLALLTLATGATIPTSTPQIVDGNLYYVVANSLGVIQISETEGGPAINFTNTGTQNGSGELFSLRCETQLFNVSVSGGSGYTQALSLPVGALINVAAIHRASASSCSTLFERQLEWSASGASIPDTFSATNNPDLIHNALVGSTIRSKSGFNVSVTSDGSTVSGLSFDLSGNIELDANAITDSTISLPDGYLWMRYVQSTEAGIRFVRDQFSAIGIMDYRFKMLKLDNLADGVRNSPATVLTIYGNIEPTVQGESVIASTSGTIHLIPFFVSDITSTGGGEVVFPTTQANQLAALYNATTLGTGNTAFSTTALANAGGGLTQQQVRDALLLVPGGAGAAGSIDAYLEAVNNRTQKLASRVGIGASATHSDDSITTSDGLQQTITANPDGSYTVAENA